MVAMCPLWLKCSALRPLPLRSLSRASWPGAVLGQRPRYNCALAATCRAQNLQIGGRPPFFAEIAALGDKRGNVANR